MRYLSEKPTLKEIEKLITDKVVEDLYLEYKASDSIGSNNDRKAKLCKEVSAMANSEGGWIIIGVSEPQNGNKGVPDKIDDGVDPTEFYPDRLNQLLNDGISPPIADIKIHTVPLRSSENVLFVFRVQKSYNPLHKCKDNKIYRRLGSEAKPMEGGDVYDHILNSQHSNGARRFLSAKVRDKILLPLYSHYHSVASIFQQTLHPWRLDSFLFNRMNWDTWRKIKHSGKFFYIRDLGEYDLVEKLDKLESGISDYNDRSEEMRQKMSSLLKSVLGDIESPDEYDRCIWRLTTDELYSGKHNEIQKSRTLYFLHKTQRDPWRSLREKHPDTELFERFREHVFNKAGRELRQFDGIAKDLKQKVDEIVERLEQCIVKTNPFCR